MMDRKPFRGSCYQPSPFFLVISLDLSRKTPSDPPFLPRICPYATQGCHSDVHLDGGVTLTRDHGGDRIMVAAADTGGIDELSI